MRGAWTWFAVLAAATVGLTAPEQPPELLPPPKPVAVDGYYKVSGHVEDQGEKREYKGLLAMVKRGDRYLVEWVRPRAVGVGTMRDGTLTVGSATVSPIVPTVSRMRLELVDGRPRFVGTWVAADGSGGVETWTWLTELE